VPVQVRVAVWYEFLVSSHYASQRCVLSGVRAPWGGRGWEDDDSSRGRLTRQRPQVWIGGLRQYSCGIVRYRSMIAQRFAWPVSWVSLPPRARITLVSSAADRSRVVARIEFDLVRVALVLGSHPTGCPACGPRRRRCAPSRLSKRSTTLRAGAPLPCRGSADVRLELVLLAGPASRFPFLVRPTRPTSAPSTSAP